MGGQAVVAVLLCSATAWGGSPWRFWTKADGLKESVVFGLTEDNSGHILVKSGDVASLSVLDGYTVGELPGPHAYGRFLSSEKGTIWTFDARSIDVHDSTGWHEYQNPDIARFARKSSMLQTPWFTYSVFHGIGDRMDVIPDGGGDDAFLLFPDRLVEWNRKSQSSHIVRRAAETCLRRFRDLQQARDGSIWVTGEQGIARLRTRAAKDEWTEISGPPAYRDFIYPSEGALDEVFVSATRNDGKRAVLRFSGQAWQEIYAAGITVSRLKGWRGPEGHLWIQNERKIIELDTAGKAMAANEGDAISGLTTAVLTESDNAFWLGTTTGVARYALPLWRTPREIASADAAVSGMAEDARGRMWFVANNRLLGEDHGRWREYEMPTGKGEPLLSDNIVALSTGELAITANALHNILLFRPETGSFSIVPNPEGFLTGQIAVRKAGGLWVQLLQQNRDGWELWSFNAGRFRKASDTEFTQFIELKSILETENGDIWLAATNGAGRVRQGRLHIFTKADGFEESGVFSLAAGQDGRLFLGAREAITEFDGERFRRIHPIDLAESLAIGNDGTLWAASGSGIHRFTPGAWIDNDMQEGLAANSVRKVVADSQGRIWTGTGHGISLYFPMADTDPPITSINEERNVREVPPSGKVRLVFTGVDKWKFTPRERLLFSWRLDGGRWSDFSSEQFVSFDGLGRGSHRFEARAMDRNGNIDLHPAGFTFSVMLPWYAQTTFLYLAGLGALLIIALARMLWRYHARLKFQGSHDPLTGLSNCALFDLRLEEAISAGRQKDLLVAVLLLDLDRFKMINDTLGHRIGDLFLQEVGKRLSAAVRKQDTLARLGGDEFAVIVPQLRDREEAEVIAAQLVRRLREPYRIESFELQGSASIGVSLYPEHGTDAGTLRRLADIAMYQCKVRSKDEYAVFDPEIDSGGALQSAHMTALIREALEKEYFEIQYQPIIGRDGSVLGFEALLRLVHPELGTIQPDDFIGISEHTGLIMRVGKWVLQEAAKQAAIWRVNGSPELRINVNVSNVQLMQSGYAEEVLQILSESGLDPGALTLEITETQMMRNMRQSMVQLDRLREAGVSIALDDFGTGYSTLGSLHSLPIDFLKIDRCFVERLHCSEGVSMIEAITTLSHSFGYHLVAEGVETLEQFRTLRRVGCDTFQGFLLGRPLSTSEATELLSTETIRTSLAHAS